MTAGTITGAIVGAISTLRALVNDMRQGARERRRKQVHAVTEYAHRYGKAYERRVLAHLQDPQVRKPEEVGVDRSEKLRSDKALAHELGFDVDDHYVTLIEAEKFAQEFAAFVGRVVTIDPEYPKASIMNARVRDAVSAIVERGDRLAP